MAGPPTFKRAMIRTILRGLDAELLALFGFVDQHHRDAVADGVAALALVANEPLAVKADGRAVIAGWAGQDLEQLRIDAHGVNGSAGLTIWARACSTRGLTAAARSGR